MTDERVNEVSKRIEIFTDSGRFGDQFTERVKGAACPRCVITVYDAHQPEALETMRAKAEAYGVTILPSVAVDGHLVDMDSLQQGTIRKGLNPC
ncbi:hypothetical protein ACVNS2_21455 [Paenibacillus caseinilyticus]|uniref:Glutaredoxin n=1 Tax=Paenibacillus mucilaginosus K02 TaxID=997761 RepID=I0BLI4_9BACL|nr:hypothetical protein [Paenibacillus mucilaginosus]AFH63231.2 hypothetical protein B2K_21420 [Paenibacillus mucilaginosus K02]